MTDHESTFNQWKKETRRDALEKELDRLSKVSRRQNYSIKKLRHTLFIVITVAIGSWLALFILKPDLSGSSDINPGLPPDTMSIPESTRLADSSVFDKENTTIPRELEIITPTIDTVKFQIPDDGILFTIQIGAYLGVDMERFRSNMVSLYQDSSAGINQFTLGVLSTYEEAAEFRDIVQSIGFEDAYITAFRNGHRVSIQQALSTRANNPTGIAP